MYMTELDVIYREYADADMAPILNKFHGDDEYTEQIKNEFREGYYEADKIIRWINENSFRKDENYE